jgi:hypothetical protein
VAARVVPVYKVPDFDDIRVAFQKNLVGDRNGFDFVTRRQGWRYSVDMVLKETGLRFSWVFGMKDIAVQ